jgi:2-alkenal reductase
VAVRRLAPYFVGLSLLLILAFGVAGISDAQADRTDRATAHVPYTVSLVSQAATDEDGDSTALSVADVADVAERANAAVVTVYTYVGDAGVGSAFPPADRNVALPPVDDDGRAPTPLGAGSGWILTEDGHVVTNAHVVQDADSFVVQYFDGTQVEADLIGTDDFQDVAVLKVSLDGGDKVPGVATIGDSASLRPGDAVVAIGSPLGEFTNSVSDGIVGGLERALDTGHGTTLANLIQHDAEISPGNSGGPLLNMQGEVIGMNVAKVETTGTNGATATGLNFAIDGNTVVDIAETIVATNASITFPYLGIQTRATEAGALVVAVEPGGPAARAGLAEGDTVSSVDGAAVDGENGLMDVLFEHDPGDTVALGVERSGGSIEIDVVLGERPVAI